MKGTRSYRQQQSCVSRGEGWHARTGRGGEREAQAPAKATSGVGTCGRSGSMPSGDSLQPWQQIVGD